MSNAAVIMNTVLRMQPALLGKGSGSARLSRVFIAGVKPHVINGKGNGKRY